MIPSLRDHLLSSQPNAPLEAHLLRKYHATLAERLWLELTVEGSHEREFFERTPTVWLHPRACWAARLLRLAPELFERIRGQAWQDLHRSRTPLPELEVLTGDYDDPWCATARGYLEDYDRMLGKDYSIEMSELSEWSIRDRLADAGSLIAAFWPEAHAEQELILRTVVAVQGGGYMYGSFQNMLGSVFVAQDSLATDESVVEMLLHEVGHQSLFVHTAFHELVVNGDSMVAHPLRCDPRPIAGTVHAAHVLGRLATGFTKWCNSMVVPDSVCVRRDELANALDVTLNTLQSHARWTREGEVYFEDLLKCSAPYRSVERVGASHGAA